MLHIIWLSFRQIHNCQLYWLYPRLVSQIQVIVDYIPYTIIFTLGLGCNLNFDSDWSLGSFVLPGKKTREEELKKFDNRERDCTNNMSKLCGTSSPKSEVILVRITYNCLRRCWRNWIEWDQYNLVVIRVFSAWFRSSSYSYRMIVDKVWCCK